MKFYWKEEYLPREALSRIYKGTAGYETRTFADRTVWSVVFELLKIWKCSFTQKPLVRIKFKYCFTKNDNLSLILSALLEFSWASIIEIFCSFSLSVSSNLSIQIPPISLKSPSGFCQMPIQRESDRKRVSLRFLPYPLKFYLSSVKSSQSDQIRKNYYASSPLTNGFTKSLADL